MEDTIQVDGAYQAAVTQILQEELNMDAKEAAAILADGRIDKTEFYQHRQQLKIFPSALLLSATPAARLLGDSFFQKAGLDQDFFVDLYDETFDDAAGKGGPKDEAIDSYEDVAELRKRIQDFVKEHKAKILEQLRKGIAERAADLIQEGDVSVRCGDDHVVHVTVTKSGPVPIEPLKRVFYDQATTLLPQLASRLFVRNDKVVLKPPLPGTAEGNLIRGGFTVHSEIYAKFIPNREAYVRMSVQSNSTPEGRKQYVISMQQLSDPQEKAYQLPKLDHEMGSLTGTITLTETADGGTKVEMKVDANPDLDLIPDLVISSFRFGVPGQLLDSARAVASHLSVVTYYQGCLVERRASCVRSAEGK